MDFKDVINQLASRVEKLKDSIQTEEATKNAFIMPFLQALGYDVFNPLEVIPEFTCDIGTKKGEKVDYAINRDGQPIMLVECKHWSQDLTLHDNQLLRYFHVTTAKFGLLTNGIIYKFYTDLIEPNKMDEKPFFEIDLLNLKDYQINELKKFHKSYFDLDSIYSTASELKYSTELKQIIGKEFNDPTPEFVRFFTRQVYDGIITQKVLDQFTPILKRTISTYMNDLITSKIKGVLNEAKKDSEETKTETPKIQEMPENVVFMSEDGKIVTTKDEIDGYNIVKAILYNTIDISRVVDRDTNSYFGILFDDNNRKPICRLYFNSETVRYIATFDENKIETKNKIESISDIYKYADEIRAIAKYYLEN